MENEERSKCRQISIQKINIKEIQVRLQWSWTSLYGPRQAMILSTSVQTKLHTKILDDKRYRMISKQYTIKMRWSKYTSKEKKKGYKVCNACAGYN